MIPHWLKGVAKKAHRKESKFQRRPRGQSYRPVVEMLEDRVTPAFTGIVTSAGDTNATGTLTAVPGSALATGELRWVLNAINALNGTFGTANVSFDIGAVGTSQTITINSALGSLPTLLVAGTRIDGWSQGVGAQTAPLITIDGANLEGGFGLNIQASNTTIVGLRIQNFGQIVSGGGNDTGIGIFGSATNVSLFGNHLLNNDQYGLWIGSNVTNVLVGTNLDGNSDVEDRNVISGNDNIGILVDGDNNSIFGNYIGTKADGSTIDANGGDGIYINTNASGNIIGFDNALRRNVIAGNGFSGVAIFGSINRLFNNYIGTDSTGTLDRGNSTVGVYVNGANNQIGGATGFGNVISGNASDGIWLNGAAANNNAIFNNLIGTNAAGSGDLGNSGNGIEITNGAHDNRINSGNVISGNDLSGVRIAHVGTSFNDVSGNLIGLNAAGTAALGNEQRGIIVDSAATNNSIGAVGAASRNIISGNKLQGILFSNTGTSNNLVVNNYIGTNPTGTAAIGNGDTGVTIWAGASNNTLGSTAAGGNNVISGNTGAGVDINTAGAAGATGNLLVNNYIGTAANGLTALANSTSGVRLDSVSGNSIGGVNAGNVISGNIGAGISLTTAGSNNVIQGNFIGVAVNGSTPVANGGAGVSLSNVSNNTVGGTATGAGNLITGNAGAGVAVLTAGNGNLITRNFIDLNGDLGINLTGTANNSQAFPTLTYAVINGTTVTVAGSLTSAANANFTIDFYSSPLADPSGFGEGRVYVGSASVTTNGSGVASFTSSFALPSGVAAGNILSATARDNSGNTSEFSRAETITGAATTFSIAGVADPATTGTADSFTVTALDSGGRTVKGYTGTVTFTSTDPAASLPANATFTAGTGVITRSVTFNTSGARTLTVTDIANSTLTDTVTVNVQTATTTSVVTSGSPSFAGQAVTFTVVVTAGSGTPPGSVTLTSSISGTLGTVGLNNGMATLTTSNLGQGTHTITASYGGSTFYLTSSGTVSQSVLSTPATVTLTSGGNPSVFGQPVVFTATVASLIPGTTPPPAGTVDFFVNGVLTANDVAISGNTASFVSSSLAAGNQIITATYNGNSTYATANATPLIQLVNKADTTTALTTSPNPSATGSGITLTATVGALLPGAGTPTGNVTFSRDGIAFYTTALTGGTVSITTGSGGVPVLPGGDLAITVTYNGSANFNTSSSAAATQVINIGTATFLESSLNPSIFGQIVTFKATVVADNGAVPVGNVIFTNIGTGATLGTATLNAGIASINVSALGVASTNVLATYSGFGKFNGSFATLTQVVNAAQTTTSLSTSLSSSVVGEAVTFTALVSVLPPGMGPATGNVVFSFSGPGSISPVTVAVNSSGQATLTTTALSIGTWTVSARFAGSTNFSASDATPVQVTVAKATPTVAVTSDLNPANLGIPVTLTAAIAPLNSNAPAPTGSVTFYSDGVAIATETIPDDPDDIGTVTVETTVSNLTIGSHAITATYNGDTNYTVADAPALTQTIQGAATTTALTATPASPSAPGQAITLNAQATYSGPVGQEPATPLSGTITFKDGSTVLETVTVDNSGAASLSISNPPTGSHNYSAVYSGDSLYETSTGSLTYTVQKGTTTSTLTGSTNTAIYGRPVKFTVNVAAVSPATGTPTGTVTFYDGGVQIGTGELSNGVATFSTSSLTKGNHQITAKYAGDANFAASDAAGTFNVFVGLVPFIFTR